MEVMTNLPVYIIRKYAQNLWHIYLFNMDKTQFLPFGDGRHL